MDSVLCQTSLKLVLRIGGVLKHRFDITVDVIALNGVDCSIVQTPVFEKEMYMHNICDLRTELDLESMAL